MREAVSYVGSHERSPAELIEEGLGLPEAGAVVSFEDARHGRPVRLISPTRAAAEELAKILRPRARRRRVLIEPLAEALA